MIEKTFRRRLRGAAGILAAAVLFPALNATASAQQVELETHRFPERDTTRVSMLRAWRIPDATMEAKVSFRDGQFRIEVEYKNMKPAVLFSGEVTCYVLWGVGRDGEVENLGELWVRPESRDDKINFSTGLRNFGLLVTAEPYFLVNRPSALVLFQSGEADKGSATTVTLEALRPAPRIGNETLANIAYDGDTPLDLLQAQKVFELAQQEGADRYASQLFDEARLALQQATVMSANRARRGAQEYARRSVAAANEAIRISLRSRAAEELEATIARRQAEMDRLEQEVRDAREAAESERREVEAARGEIDRQQQELARIRQERQQLEAARDDLLRQQAALRTSLQGLQGELSEARSQLSETQGELSNTRDELGQVQRDLERSQQEKAALQNTLQSALSQIADTRASAEGFIVNLPDILFDVNRATLKPEARVTIAKLAGILLIMNDLSMRIEGHTDSTGSDEYNLQLSQARANSVLQFMIENDVAPDRLQAIGLGESRPVADNSTAAGRQQNRRVELIIRQGPPA